MLTILKRLRKRWWQWLLSVQFILNRRQSYFKTCIWPRWWGKQYKEYKERQVHTRCSCPVWQRKSTVTYCNWLTALLFQAPVSETVEVSFTSLSNTDALGFPNWCFWIAADPNYNPRASVFDELGNQKCWYYHLTNRSYICNKCTFMTVSILR